MRVGSSCLALLALLLGGCVQSGSSPHSCEKPGEACCEDGQCGGGLECRFGVCAPSRVVDMGRPCSRNDACGSGICQLMNERAVCTAICRDASDCLSGWTCPNPPEVGGLCTCHSTEERCNGADDDCNGVIDEPAPADRDCLAQSSGLRCRHGSCQCIGTQCGADCADLVIDVRHCGSCEISCSAEAPATAVCAAGSCAQQLVIEGSGGSPGRPVFDSESMYWSDDDRGMVFRRSKADGAVTTLASQRPSPGGIAVDATHLYWYEDHAIVSMPKEGGEVTVLAVDGQTPQDLVVDETSIYWSDFSNTDPDGNAIWRIAKSGGTAHQLAVGGNSSKNLAVDSDFLYWADYSDGRIMKVPKHGGSVQEIASRAQFPLEVAVDADNVYWVEFGNNGGRVAMRPKDGGSATVLAKDLDSPISLVLDDVNVYFTMLGEDSSSTGSVMRVPKSGGDALVLSGNLEEPFNLTRDGADLYWVASQGATPFHIMQLSLEE